jgi:7-cyano-7-deazaguanine synthase in queuosine biosynthesis
LTWHIVVETGSETGALPSPPTGDPKFTVALGESSHPAFVPNNVIATIGDVLGRRPPVAAVDLVHLAMAVYASDLRVNRKHSLDRWSRALVLHAPVADPQRWAGCAEKLARMLRFLTGDQWEFSFRGRAVSEGRDQAIDVALPQVVSLFSGGLDSLVGAVDLLAKGSRVALVAHHGAGITNSVQTNVLNSLTAAFKDQVTPLPFYVQPARFPTDDGERSMRGRSFLFLALGAAVAATLGGGHTLVVAENGLISVNVPLSLSRTGSSSTRTTHPYYLELFREFLAEIGLSVALSTPYRFQTKGEMLRSCSRVDVLRAAAPLTMSCSHPEAGRFRGHSPVVHCGYCVPCIIRRAALRAGELPEGEYSVDVIKAAPPANTLTGRDLRAFQMAIERMRDARKSRFLFDVLRTGPLPAADAAKYADVYRRGMGEVSALLA